VSDPSSDGPDPVTASAEDEDEADSSGGRASVETRPSGKELKPRGGEDGMATDTGMTGNGSAWGRGWRWWRQLGGGCGGMRGAIGGHLFLNIPCCSSILWRRTSQ
jgi:hypothetical protein